MIPNHLDEVKSLLRNAIVNKAYTERGKFCESFALISRFCGWQWRFKEILMEDITYTYDMLTNKCLEKVKELDDKALMGKHFVISCSTGRINFDVIYYGDTHSVNVHITSDIA
jgi:hypothetical protein